MPLDISPRYKILSFEQEVIIPPLTEGLAATISGEVGGRLATTVDAAINQAGNFVNDVINAKLDTQAKQILGDFTFGASGAIKMITDANNGLWISPTGILGKKAGVNTFAINTTGEITAFVLNVGTINASTVTISNLTVGTNVGLGTAQDSAGVTTIIGNTVTTSYVNALDVNAATVSASISITSPTITGGIFQTATSGQRVKISSSPQNNIEFLEGAIVKGNLKIGGNETDGYYLELFGEGGSLEIGTVIGASGMSYVSMPWFSASGKASVGQVALEGSPNYPTEVGLAWEGGGVASFRFDLGTSMAKLKIPVGTNLY